MDERRPLAAAVQGNEGRRMLRAMREFFEEREYHLSCNLLKLDGEAHREAEREAEQEAEPEAECEAERPPPQPDTADQATQTDEIEPEQ